MSFTRPVVEIIRRRYSCRNYLAQPLEENTRRRLADFLAANSQGPLGTRARFLLVAATEGDRRALKGLGTYGFIKGATGFIVATVASGPNDLEDFGYLMEHAILFATDLGLGTCWLGGTFRKSRFGRTIVVGPGETMPAVTSVGYISPDDEKKNTVRRRVRGAFRLPPENLIFGVEAAGAYALPLDMVRLAPSASNKQPWRVVRSGDEWHFFLRRTKGYGKGSLLFRMLRLADLQRVDLGIAMCHFELAAREAGLNGQWIHHPSAAPGPIAKAQYVITWKGTSTGS